MRKQLASMLLIVLAVLAACGAYAEGGFTVAGYDHQDTGHVWDTNLFFPRMEELTGVHVEPKQYTTAESWAAAKQAMFAPGGEMPDALFKAYLTTQETQALYEAGHIIDLLPLLPEHAPNLWALLESNPEWMEAVTLPGGAIAALPAIDPLQFNNAMWINQTWLKKLNLAMPTTADELLTVLRAFRDSELNGNSKRDEIPLSFASMWDLRFLAHAFGINANDYYLTCENGVVSEVLTSDANRAFLTWLHQLYEEGLLDQDGFTGLRDIGKNIDEETPITYGVMLTSTPVQLVYLTHLTDYVLLPPLQYEGEQVYRDLTGDVVRGAFAITSACKDPATLLHWVDALYTEEGFILAEAGKEGTDFTSYEDGGWSWNVSGDALTGMLADSTLRAGVSMPGWSSTDFQRRIDDEPTRHVVENLAALKAIDTLPVPMVYLTEAQQQRASEIIYELGMYAEYQMVWFVTGDTPLNDETWAAFCQQVKAHDVDELVAIFQAAVDSQQ